MNPPSFQEPETLAHTLLTRYRNMLDFYDGTYRFRDCCEAQAEEREDRLYESWLGDLVGLGCLGMSPDVQDHDVSTTTYVGATWADLTKLSRYLRKACHIHGLLESNQCIFEKQAECKSPGHFSSLTRAHQRQFTCITWKRRSQPDTEPTIHTNSHHLHSSNRLLHLPKVA